MERRLGETHKQTNPTVGQRCGQIEVPGRRHVGTSCGAFFADFLVPKNVFFWFVGAPGCFFVLPEFQLLF